MRIVFDHFVVDCDQSILSRDGELIPLSPKVFQTLSLLVLARGRLVGKREFMEALWPDRFVEEANLTQNIFVLRKVLGSDPAGHAYIETVPKRGYRFIGNTSEEEFIEAAPEPSETSVGADSESNSATLLWKSAAPEISTPTSPWAATIPAQYGPLRHTSLAFGAFALLILVVGMYLVRSSERQAKFGIYQRLTSDGLPKDLQLIHATIVSEGKNLYFTELKDNETVLAEVPTSGGTTTYMPLPFRNAHVVDLDRRGQKLLFGSTWQTDEPHCLMSKEASSGKDSEVFGLRAHDANWSPDDKELAFIRLGQLFVRSANGVIRLTASVEGLAYWPRWSPDGKKIRFSENFDGYQDRLWEVDSSGADLHQLFEQQADSDHICCGSWTASGRAFMYISNGFQSSSIHVRPERGAVWAPRSVPIDIPSAPLESLSAAVPSLDGKHIFAIGAQLRGRLMKVDPTSRRPELYLDGMSAEGVSFSPDRKDIVWTAYPEGTLWRSRADGSSKVRLTQEPLIARFPRWSPDGSTIVFIAAHPGSDWGLYTIPAGGGVARTLLPESSGQGVASWSPDGRSLAFGHILDMSKARTRPFSIELFRIGDMRATTIPNSDGLWTARWSPDGRFVSAVTRDNHTLRLFDMAKGTWINLAQGSVNDVVWTFDSKYLYFDTDVGAEPLLYRVRLKDHKVERWATLKNLRRAGFFAPWLGVAPDGAPILLEDASIQEVYSIALDLP